MSTTKKTKKAAPTIRPAAIDPVAARQKLGINQTQFWSRVGVTQSGGSRYETGRKIPRPVQALLTIAYGTDRQAQAVIDQLRKKESSDE